MIRHPVVQVLREHFPRDIALSIDAKVNEIYLSEWKTQIAAVNADYKIHISEMLTGHGTYEFDSWLLISKEDSSRLFYTTDSPTLVMFQLTH